MVTSVAFTEHLFTTRLVRSVADKVGDDVQAVWLVGGLWLQTVTTGLLVFNDLDENGLDSETPKAGSDLRITGV